MGWADEEFGKKKEVKKEETAKEEVKEIVKEEKPTEIIKESTAPATAKEEVKEIVKEEKKEEEIVLPEIRMKRIYKKHKKTLTPAQREAKREMLVRLRKEGKTGRHKKEDKQ